MSARRSRALGASVAAFLVFACTEPSPNVTATSSTEQALIATIEVRATLPDGARPLSDYARHYAYGPQGEVLAVFLVPSSVGGEDEGCEVEGALDDGAIEAQPCTTEEIEEIRSSGQRMAARDGRAGQSRWHEDYRELPAVNDGGCSVIELAFDPATQAFERIVCNGEA